MQTQAALIFDHNLTARSYIESKVLVDLKSKMDLSLYSIDFEISKSYMEILAGIELEIRQIRSVKSVRYLTYLHSLSYWRERAPLSNGFKSRLRSIQQGRREFYDDSNLNLVSPSIRLKNNFALMLSKSIREGLPKIVLYLLGFWTFGKIRKADHFYFVTVGGAESFGDVLVTFLKKKYPNSKFFYVTENWDNLETKAVLWRKPDAIGAWQETNRTYMSKVHNMPVESIRNVGSPRRTLISSTVANSKKLGNSIESHGHILYACGGSSFELELKRFRYIQTEIKKHFNQPIVFLPHPRSYKEYVGHISECPGVENQQEKVRNEVLNCFRQRSLLSLEFVGNLVANATLVVSSLSTMALEAASLGIKTIVIDIGEIIGTENVWATEYFDYFSSLKTIENLWVVREIMEMNKVLGLAQVYTDSHFQGAAVNLKMDDNKWFVDRFIALQDTIGP